MAKYGVEFTLDMDTKKIMERLTEALENLPTIDYHVDQTEDKVVAVLERNGFLPDDILKVIEDFRNAGIVFCERTY